MILEYPRIAFVYNEVLVREVSNVNEDSSISNPDIMGALLFPKSLVLKESGVVTVSLASCGKGVDEQYDVNPMKYDWLWESRGIFCVYGQGFFEAATGRYDRVLMSKRAFPYKTFPDYSRLHVCCQRPGTVISRATTMTRQCLNTLQDLRRLTSFCTAVFMNPNSARQTLSVTKSS